MHAETFNAGNVNGSWDGLDDFGTPVPSGSYRKVLRNGALYNNIGVIGNTGLPPVTSGHVPYFIEGVAVDAQGKIYTVHDWDEPHFDLIRWSPDDGKSEMNTGHAISEALLKDCGRAGWFHCLCDGLRRQPQRPHQIEILDLADQHGSRPRRKSACN
jgi:hypothetical protein